MYTIAFPTRSPRAESVQMEIHDIPGVQRSGKAIDKALKAAGVQKTPKPKPKDPPE